VISRFIVRTHHLAKQRLWWRTGVVLTQDGNDAIVQADLDDGKIKVWIRGGLHGRRALLAVIRDHLRLIGGAIKGLQVEERVPVPHAPEVLIPFTFLLRLEAEGERVTPYHGVSGRIDVSELLNGVMSPEERERQRRTAVDPRGASNYYFASGSAPQIIQEVKQMGDHIENHTKVGGAQNIVTTSVTGSAASSSPSPAAVQNPTPTESRGPWGSGSFYLFAFLAVLVAFIAGVNYLPYPVVTVPVVVIATLLGVGVVGALQLRQDDRLAEKNFLKLMLETYKRLPLLRGGGGAGKGLSQTGLCDRGRGGQTDRSGGGQSDHGRGGQTDRSGGGQSDRGRGGRGDR
jgi:hypothetical protein